MSKLEIGNPLQEREIGSNYHASSKMTYLTRKEYFFIVLEKRSRMNYWAKMTRATDKNSTGHSEEEESL